GVDGLAAAAGPSGQLGPPRRGLRGRRRAWPAERHPVPPGEVGRCRGGAAAKLGEGLVVTDQPDRFDTNRTGQSQSPADQLADQPVADRPTELPPAARAVNQPSTDRPTELPPADRPTDQPPADLPPADQPLPDQPSPSSWPPPTQPPVRVPGGPPPPGWVP